MISWVLDRVPAHSADGSVSETIIVVRETENLSSFALDQGQVRTFTASQLRCEQCGRTEWYVPELEMTLNAERELSQRAAEFLSRARKVSPATSSSPVAPKP
jgi:hypothetical protein